MKKRLLMIIGWLPLLYLFPNATLADNGPHGGYTATTDACAGCHRTHTSSTANLLLSAVPGLCYSCHGGGATGAETNVIDGVDGSNRSLRGGGFEWTRMNVDYSGSQALPVTTSHMIDGGSNIVWGYGAINPAPSPGVSGVPLTCTNCHATHGGAGAGGSPTYRLLKGSNPGNTLLFSNDSGTITQTAFIDLSDDETTKSYVVANGRYFGDHGAWSADHSVSYNAAMTTWCAQCHTRHKPLNTEASSSESGHTDSGDAIFTFRHVTNIEDNLGCASCHSSTHGNFMPPYPACVTCHVAHGTGARMGNDSDNVPWPDGTTTPNADARSALLRLDNRGVCQDCHNK